MFKRDQGVFVHRCLWVSPYPDERRFCDLRAAKSTTSWRTQPFSPFGASLVYAPVT